MKEKRIGMKDVQSETDDRNIPLDKVGISDLSYPITVLDRNKNIQATDAPGGASVAAAKDGMEKTYL
ncbi:MAG: hypothetical protein A2Y33_11555 [Spirochaetes bacterium GWF1_51_8]|nr:MAG: hypothetical protein A2Y33_11555 [Spirochaetes bacterium GWF1_51_8]